MAITSACGVEFARELGCHLVVLARECSLKEIEKIQTGQTDAGCRSQVAGCQPGGEHNPTNHPPLPLEVFVHGALCVAYSGQCLTSEDRKSTRLNSSHVAISYAVFCLKK